jgi:DNA-binding protein HU-beta
MNAKPAEGGSVGARPLIARNSGLPAGKCTHRPFRSCIVVASKDEGETVPITKTDLIAAVAAHTGSTSKDVATVLGGIEDVVVANVAKGEKVVITGFLTFDRAQRAARSGRNPQTGETIKIKASKSPKVSAGASFKKVVNGQAPAPKLAKAK